MSFKVITDAWNEFFFDPKPVEGMALFRIIWCSLLLFALLLDFRNVSDFYGPHALLSLETVKNQFNYPHLNLFHWVGVDYTTVYFFMALYTVALIFSVLGMYTRISLIIAFICMVSFHQRNIWLLSSSELLMRSITLFLICSPCGNALSLDVVLRASMKEKRLERMWAPWAMRLIQIQVSVVYLWTVWHKLKGENWLDGSAVYFATRLENMTNFPVPYVLDSIFTIKLATWGTLILEFALGALIWFKEFRKPLIIMGILFHISIEYMMSIPYFEIVMISLLILFFTPEELKSFVDSKLIKSYREFKKKLKGKLNDRLEGLEGRKDEVV